MNVAEALPPLDCLAEYGACKASFAYFADNYCWILSEADGEGEWVPFRLWDAQLEAANAIQNNRLVVALKARQLGLTWLCLAFALWLVLFHPISTVLLFSRRDTEAVDLLRRLRGICAHLPTWLKLRGGPKRLNDHEWELSNGSRIIAFPTQAGDSYTATFAFVDEADLAPDLGKLLRAVKPTIDGGGRMVLLSRADKSKPQSPFKRIYSGAKRGSNGWTAAFLPWDSRPDRDAAWYAAQKADIFDRTGSLDDLHEQYPSSDAEALSPRTLDKRLAPAWLEACFAETAPLNEATGMPAIPGLRVYAAPTPGRVYVVGADPAEGNPTSDESALCVLDYESGTQVAELGGKIEPSAFAGYLMTLCRWYNAALPLIERNNHGHAVIGWLLMQEEPPMLLAGLDGKTGWHTSAVSKVRMFDGAADAVRHKETIIRSLESFTQLASIEGGTLAAPAGEHDDRAIAYALALTARLLVSGALRDSGD